MAKCKSCGADIIWIKTTNGKNMPCDLHPVRYWQQDKGKGTVVTKNGEVISCAFEGEGFPTGCAYVPHWSTCPNADGHRKKECKK